MIKEKYHNQIMALLKEIFSKQPSCPLCEICNPKTYDMCTWNPTKECEDWNMFEADLTEEPDPCEPDWRYSNKFDTHHAIDKNGIGFFYYDKPYFDGTLWAGGGQKKMSRRFDMTEIEWTQSLRKRPEGK